MGLVSPWLMRQTPLQQDGEHVDNIQKLADLPLETKLTRGEVIDLIIEGLEADLEKQYKAKEAERDALLETTFNEVSGYIKGETRVKLQMDRDWNGDDHGGGRVRAFGVHFSLDLKSPGLKALATQVAALNREADGLRKMLDDTRHNKGKAKNAILKRFLEASPEGKTILEQIGNFKIAMQKQLTAALEAKNKVR